MTRILLTGAQGQVGWELRRTLSPLGEVVAFDRSGLDLADPDRLRTVVREARPTLIVNAAAYTAVDRAEGEESLAARINADAPRVLAEEAQRAGTWLVHYSTDYVFDGSKSGAYMEDDAPNPVNAYGRTKLAGEQAIRAVGGRHLVFRTSWVYANRGGNFLRTMLRLGREREELRIVADQVGAPTWARVIAEATSLCAVQVLPGGGTADAKAGIYHLVCGGSTSWHGFASAIFETAGAKAPRLVPIPAADYPTPAQRPANSVLDRSKLERVFGIVPPDWRAALEMCLDGDGANENARGASLARS